MKFVLLFFLALLVAGANAQSTVGLLQSSGNTAPGYTLFSPTAYNKSYLIDNCGKLVHVWNGTKNPGLAAYLLPDGNLVRSGLMAGTYFAMGGKGGYLEIVDWNDSVLWSFQHYAVGYCMHHDFCVLPNGNILAISWERKLNTVAINNGRNPNLLNGDLWSEKIIEIQPTFPSGGTIVWEWHLWDHIIQDYSSTKPNYGVVANHPELMNLNYTNPTLGYTDWIHYNSIDYNPEKDLIVIASRFMGEVYIIDHSTTAAEVSTHAGGNFGKGGDFLYRWGNPQAYSRGTSSDKKLFEPHGVRWIKNGEHKNKLIVFNNGVSRPDGDYSSVDIINIPIDSLAALQLDSSSTYGPDSLDWRYTAPVLTDFYANRVSGAVPLDNGNMLISNGPAGEIFEIDSDKNIIWQYINPVNNLGPQSQGTTMIGNGVFRADKYSPDFSGFAGRDLTAGEPVELNPINYDCGATSINASQIQQENLLLFPNPANAFLYVQSQTEIVKTVEVYNYIGVKIYSAKFTGNISIPTQLFNAGIYMVKVFGNNIYSQQTFMVAH